MEFMQRVAGWSRTRGAYPSGIQGGWRIGRQHATKLPMDHRTCSLNDGQHILLLTLTEVSQGKQRRIVTSANSASDPDRRTLRAKTSIEART